MAYHQVIDSAGFPVGYIKRGFTGEVSYFVVGAFVTFWDFEEIF